MALSKDRADVEIAPALIDAIRTLPARREITHCGVSFSVSPFEIYAECPHCHTRIKVRSFSGVTEVEDVFDAVFDWMDRAQADEIVRRRQAALRQERDD